MFHRFLRIMLPALLCTLLVGCAQSAPIREPARLSPTKETENDNLRCYPLEAADCRFLSEGEALYVLLPRENDAVLLRCQGRGLVVTHRQTVPQQAQLFSGGATVGCYDPQTRQVLLSTGSLTLPGCNALPCTDGRRLFYTTDEALMELDMDTGLHRLLRQQEGLTLIGVLEEQGLLICAQGEQSQYIRIQDGTVAHSSSRVTALATLGSRVHLCLRCGWYDCLYLGRTILPLSPSWRFLCFLPEKNAALVQREDGSLAIYDLTTGSCLAEQSPTPALEPEQAWATADGRIFFTIGASLYQWEPTWQSRRDNRVHITTLAGDNGLESCRQRGAYLENQYGLSLLLDDQATRLAPKGVLAETEPISAVISTTLSGVQTALGRFPTALVQAAFSHMGRVYLCPVRRITQDGQERAGLQFFSGRDCYLLITPSEQLPQAVTEALAALLQRQVLMHCDAWDQGDDWGKLLWDAMSPGNRAYFLSATAQNRLRTLCSGLRQAIALPDSTPRPWEQYLWRELV